MYLRHLRVQNVKLLRDVAIDFVGADGKPRMWTVFVGENRLCKTTLLQTIAVAASGRDKGTHLATDVIDSWPDLRRPEATIEIDADFEFSKERHARREYLASNGVVNRTFAGPPRLHSRLALALGRSVFDGESDQHRKCAFCEKREEQAKYRDVEHYRPKAHYWWLAWNWDNLLFACFECNRDHKGERFPLVDETTRLVAEAIPPGREQPLILDPYDPSIDPRRHIEFRRDRVQGKERWTPYGLTECGRTTITICGLDRPSLLGRYGEHVRDLVRPKIGLFEGACTSGDAQQMAAAWSTLRRSLLAPGQEFCARSRDAVRALVSVKIRERLDLDL